ncbi:MAG: glycosyltransferase family 2 protein [Lutibacter sp.]
MPKISVIVTTYNRPELLQETIEGVLNQTFQDFELIVVDNYSNYDFFAVIESIGDPRISAFQNQNEGVIAVNRNVGISYAIGEYLAFCDDDDIWLPEKLEVQMEMMKKLQKAHQNVIIHTNTILFGENRKESVTNKTNIIQFEDFFSGNPLTYSSILLTKSEYIIFDEDQSKRAVEDADLWIDLLLNNYTFKLIENPLVRYRDAITSASNDNLSFSYLRYLYIIINAILKYKLKSYSNLKFNFFVIKMLFKYTIRSLQKK